MRTLLKLFFILLVAHCHGGEQGGETNRPKPVLKTDDAHHVSSHTNAHPERYYIAPCSSIVLDATGYTFKPNSPVPEGKPVDRIEILRQQSDKEQPAGQRRYLLAWTPGETQYELSSATLQPRTGSPPFDGFKAGERWFLFIGSNYETSKLFVVWSGVMEVR
jgi:hypothetical protein